MASTVLPNGIIIPEKYSRDWYNDLYHNWEELDNLLSASSPGDGTLTIQKNGDTVGTFSANQATDETINIEVPAVNDATLTIQQNGIDVQTFTANASTNATANIQCVDLSSAQTVAGNKTLTGTTSFTSSPGIARNTNPFLLMTTNDYDKGTAPASDLYGGVRFLCNPNAAVTDKITGGFYAIYAANGYNSVALNARNYDENSNNRFFSASLRVPNDSALPPDFVPSVSQQINLGSSTAQWNNAYIKSLTINGTAAGDILTHNASEFVPVSGGAVFTGDSLSRIDDTTFLAIRGGSAYNQGAQLTLYGKDVSGYEGYAYLMASDGTDIAQFALRPNSHATILCTSFRPDSGNPTLGDALYRWGQIYSTNSTISTSDSRLKNSVKDIDDTLLDAWGNIEPKQYKFNDATEKKGEKARYHTGYLAQDIQAECEKQGVNASDYGLFCYDEWDEQEEVSEEIETEKDGKKVKEKRIIQPKSEKGNIYALRYEEALVVECKYLRRCIARLTARIEELEKGNNTK